MLEDTRAEVVVTTTELAPVLNGRAAKQVRVDADAEANRGVAVELAAMRRAPRAPRLHHLHLGLDRPAQGVMIEHHSPVALVAWANGIFTDEEVRGVLFSTSICFDLSGVEIFVPWSRGGAAVLVQDAFGLTFAVRSARRVTPSSTRSRRRWRSCCGSMRSLRRSGP